jgi:hypothetical protein
MVAADVPDALVAVLEHSDAEEDADDERDHQHHEQEAPHVLLSPGELAHACVFPSCLSGVWAIVRAVQVLQGRALLLLIGGRLPATAQVCRPVSSMVWLWHRILALCHARHLIALDCLD